MRTEVPTSLIKKHRIIAVHNLISLQEIEHRHERIVYPSIHKNDYKVNKETLLEPKQKHIKAIKFSFCLCSFWTNIS